MPSYISTSISKTMLLPRFGRRPYRNLSPLGKEVLGWLPCGITDRVHGDERLRMRFGAEHLCTALHRRPQTPIHREKRKVKGTSCEMLHLLAEGILRKFPILGRISCPVPPVEISGMENLLPIYFYEEGCALIGR